MARPLTSTDADREIGHRLDVALMNFAATGRRTITLDDVTRGLWYADDAFDSARASAIRHRNQAGQPSDNT